MAIVALGGFGRGELSPYSDVDVLFLRGPRTSDPVLEFAKRLVRAVWDVGLSLGHTIATTGEILSLAKSEVFCATALLEDRFLIGAKDIADNLNERVRKTFCGGAATRFCRSAVDAIRAEHAKFGSAVHLLEPDVKRSAGGLRDYHLLRWLGLALHGTTDPLELEQQQVLGVSDGQVVLDAYEFLLRLRAELHFHANKANDLLTRAEQVRIAKLRRYEDTPSLRAVEQLMREYFRHTTAIADVVDRLVDGMQPTGVTRSIRDRLFSRRAGAGIWIQGSKLKLSAEARRDATATLENSLDLVELAVGHEVGFDRDTVEALRATYSNATADPQCEPGVVSEQAAERFLRILARPEPIHRIVRTLHQTGILERLIPEFEHARCLLQFNAYHKYTVDEHTFVALQFADELAAAENSFGRAYRKIVRKDLLRLVILLHDLGKGYAEDHCAVGRRIAENVARRLRLNEEDGRTVVFLVDRHLYLSELAYRRDVSDQKLRVAASREIGNVQLLRMLYVFTAIDTMAVGPEMFTEWKSSLLTHLYRETRGLFEDENEEEAAGEWMDPAEQLRQQLLENDDWPESATALIRELPAELLAASTVDRWTELVREWTRADASQAVHVSVDYRANIGTCLYTVRTHEHTCDGLFAKICGSLSAHRLEVLCARIYTLSDGTVIDQFEVIDKHHAGAPTPDRVQRVGKTIMRVLAGQMTVEDVLWSTRTSAFAPKREILQADPTRVVVDNDSSASCTVIDVFTSDRRGLLYILAAGIHRLGLSVAYAKIATYADEVVDVIYVQNAEHNKICDEQTVRGIQNRLLEDIRHLASDPRSMGF